MEKYYGEAFEWKCTECGKDSNYKAGEIYYCDEHWDIFMGYKAKELLNGKDDDNASDDSTEL